MSFMICDRCGDVTLDHETCTCGTTYDAVEVRRRYRDALELARSHTPADEPTNSSDPRPAAAIG